MKESNKNLLEKGIAKVPKGKKIHETKDHDLSNKRLVLLNDVRKTRIYVKSTDTRSDDEIRAVFDTCW